VDSLAWLKAMAWDLRGNMEEEVDRALSIASVGPDRTADLFPGYDYAAHQPIVGQGAVVDGVFEPEATADDTREPKRPAWLADAPQVAPALTRLRGAMDALPSYLGRGDGIGSNSWVVDGEHSATGAPILANDPHLGVSMPGIWVQMGLHCREVSEACPLDVSGFTFSGVPGVIIGHNADIAWGLTNLGPDVTDLYVERVRGDEWFRDGAWRPLTTRTETIEVRGQDDETLTVRSTTHGPLLSDVSEDLADVADDAPVDREDAGEDEDYALALQWTALEPGLTADAIYDINLAGDWDEFRDAVASFDVPAQNVVYADREGHIGYQAPGRVPIRKSGNDGLMPAAGWLPENDWTGDYVPFEGLPRVLDPDEGFVVTANQAVIGPDYPYFLTDDWDKGYRSERIRDLLGGQDTWSVEQMTRLQMDNRHPLAPVLTPYLLDLAIKRDYYRAGQDLLRDWDFDQDADSAAAAYFNVVWRNLLALTFRDELPKDLWPDGGDRWVAAVTGLLDDPRNGWWDDLDTDDVVEDRDDILHRALLAARDEMTARQALNPDEWSWGFLHRLDLREPTLGDSGIGAVEWLVNRGGWEVGGGSAAVDAGGWDASVEDRPYAVTTAPSMRMVVSLGDLDDSRWINLTGVSGHPFSDHYTDQTDLWARGDTLPWPFSADAVDAAEEHTLTLVPAAE